MGMNLVIHMDKIEPQSTLPSDSSKKGKADASPVVSDDEGMDSSLPHFIIAEALYGESIKYSVFSFRKYCGVLWATLKVQKSFAMALFSLK